MKKLRAKNTNKNISQKGDFTRRRFIKTTSFAAGTMAIISSPLFAKTFSNSDPIAQTKYGKISGVKQ